ncbi:MAG: DUF5615 family PIN-like protein [Blastocatellia bacterium]
MKVKFQADADLNQHIVKAVLRHEPTIDFQTATLANLEGVPDPEVLQIAADEGRLLLSHDQTTMPIHFAEFISSQNSPGLIIVPKHLPISIAVENLVLIWAASEAEEWINRVRYIPI